MVVTGQDAELVACQRVAAGTQSMTVYKPIAKLATSAVELAVKVGRRAPVIAKASTYNGRVDVPSVLLEVIVVTRENLQSTVVADGYLSYRDVYRYVVPPPER